MHRKYGRDTVEFGRVLAFSDGLYAIAMTLLIVSVTVPNIADEESVSDRPVLFMVIPLGILSSRWKPEGADELLSG